MKRNSIFRKLLKNYILMFFISTILVFVSYSLLLFADGTINKDLVSRVYTADKLMKDDYNSIDVDKVIKNNGSMQVVTKELDVIKLGGSNGINQNILTTKEWSDFLIHSKHKDNKYNYSIEYNESEDFWLVVTFPVSLRIIFGIVTNIDILSTDFTRVLSIILSIITTYIILLIISTMIYSKISSNTFVKPLKALCESTRNLADGNYKERVNLNLTAEFSELEHNFNHLANQLEIQNKKREKSENLRKRMILDISHDLKNPLSSILGYSELCINDDIDNIKRRKYLDIIHDNSIRANKLLTDLFDLSKIDSPDFKLSLEKIDICEFLRENISSFISLFENAEFNWNFNIPEHGIFINIDKNKMERVFLNLFSNAVKYNPKGTEISVSVIKENNNVTIIIKDDGVGIDKELESDIFNPFVRTDKSRNSKTGGSGLGLAIVKKIIGAHNGTISLDTNKGNGCKFIITLPI